MSFIANSARRATLLGALLLASACSADLLEPSAARFAKGGKPGKPGTTPVEMPNAFVYGLRSAHVEFEFEPA